MLNPAPARQARRLRSPIKSTVQIVLVHVGSEVLIPHEVDVDLLETM